MKTWTVIRHAGNKNGPRVAFSGSPIRAYEFFQGRRATLKQGSILLLDHKGGLQGYHWSPK